MSDHDLSTNGDGAAEAPVMSNDDDRQRARDAGWAETIAFDYGKYTSADGDGMQWLGQGQKYEWKDDFGDVAPRNEDLEQLLYGGHHQMRKGEHLVNLELDVALDGPTRCPPVDEFADAGLHPAMLENVQLCGYASPTPIQQYTIPAVLKGCDVAAVAQTGSGKTAAYLIPTISKMMGKAKKLCGPKPATHGADYNPARHAVRAEPLVVIVVPTRELAGQIFDEARRLCYRSMLRPCVLYGGLPTDVCRYELGRGCDVLIATPGRLCDFMDKHHILTMSRVKYTIIDEADEMLSQDWEEELKKIMEGGDTNDDADHVYMMFSATFPKAARELARQYMSDDFVRIRVGRAGSSHKNIRQNVIWTDRHQKQDALVDLIVSGTVGRTIVFCNSKAAVDVLDDHLYNRGLPTTSIHSDRNQREREEAIRMFRTGKCPILIATGVTARGLDIADVVHVINYDLPSDQHGGITEYVHRIGRTARIGHRGLATSFYNDHNEDIAQDLVNVLVECDCEVPEFLQHLAPQDGQAIAFDDASDDEVDEQDGGNGHNGTATKGGVEVGSFAPEAAPAAFEEEEGAGATAAW